MLTAMALALALPNAPLTANSQTQTGPELHLADSPIFFSARHPDSKVSQIGRLAGAMYVGANRIVFVDGASQQLVFVDIANNSVAWAGRKGEGPQEFKSVRLLTRTADGGVVVWDDEHRRMHLVGVMNEEWIVADLPGYDKSVLRGGLLMQPVARYADGSLVFQGTDLPSANVFELASPREPGRFRDTIQYWVSLLGQPLTLMFETLGKEMFSSVSRNKTMSSTTLDIIFGHTVLHAQVADQLAIAQTDMPSVRVFDSHGVEVAVIPMPKGVAVSEEQVNAVRQNRISANDDLVVRMRRDQGDGFDFASGWAMRSDHIRAVPANDVAPPIDLMRGDFDGRLWLRLFRPGDMQERWQVWDLTGPRPSLAFTLVLSETEAFLDAAGDRVLVRSRDQFDVDYLVVKEIVR